MPRERPAPPASQVPPRITSTAEFADYVGLARSTVSRVLNGQPGLRRKTIERVQRAMAETGFTPNAFAKSLKGKRTSSVGVCMENLLTPTIVLKVAVLQRELRRRGYTALIEVVDPGESRQVIQHFLGMRVDAVIFIGQLAPRELEERVAELRQRAVPHLLFDQTEIPRGNVVSLDRARAMELVIDHLVGLGHRQFGLLGISGELVSIRDRLRGVETALRRHGLDPVRHTRSLDYLDPRRGDYLYGRQLAAHFLAMSEPPTALIALNDAIAMGALLELQARGKRVPQDISVVGFNNQDICEISRPMLSSVDQRIDESVAAAISMLQSQLDSPTDEVLLRLIEPHLVVRESIGPVAK